MDQETTQCIEHETLRNTDGSCVKYHVCFCHDSGDDLLVVNVWKEGRNILIQAIVCKTMPGTLFSGELKARAAELNCGTFHAAIEDCSKQVDRK